MSTRIRGCRIIGAIGIFTPGFSGGGFPGLRVSFRQVRFLPWERGQAWRALASTQSTER
nr:MAG TPA: hypothetical protein [Caudoviricetes sp.]